MTREEAKSIVRGITDKIEATTDIDDWAEFWGFTRDDYEEFLEMPIKLLEQEPCGDAISRQAVQDYIAKYLSQYLYNDVREAVEVIDEYIGELPSVTPQPKTVYISIDDAMSVFDDFMCGEVDEDGTDTFLKMLKDKAESEE